MLYCNPITGNINKVCGLKKGGFIKTMYAANLGEISGTTLDVNGSVDSITMNIDPILVTPYYWFQIAIKKNTFGFNNEAQVGDNNKFWLQTVGGTIEGFEQQVKNAFDSLIDGEGVFIGVDNTGTAHILGRISGAEMTEGTIGSGLASTDLFGGTFVFSSEELEVTPTVLAGTSIQVLDEDGVTINTITL